MITEIRCSQLTVEERVLLLKVLRSIKRKRAHKGEEKLKYVIKNDPNMISSRLM